MKRVAVLLVISIYTLSACTHTSSVYDGQYPDDVRQIVVNKCATSGCHNQLSYKNAGGLLLDTWEHMFDGGSNGSVVIPYSTGNSSLLYFINTDSAQGPILQPHMPLNAAPLSNEEYAIMRNWIAEGAPDKAGNIPFGSNAATRQKTYITQQGCDLIAVIDASKKVAMRYIPIGMDGNIESPHCVRFSNDGKYAYVSFTSGTYVQKIDATTDAVVASLQLGPGQWNLFHLSADGSKMMISDFSDQGQMRLINVDSMKQIQKISGFLQNPHGVAANHAFDTFFVTSQYGNTVYRFNLKGNYKELSIDDNLPNNKKNTLDPHEIIMSPDYSRYFLSCQASNEVRVMDAHTNKLIKVIPVGTFPQEFAMSQSKPYLLVSCQEDVTPEFPFSKGSVYVINYNTLEVVQRITGSFYQIHGIAVDDLNSVIYISSRNLNVEGPAPHHTSSCGGRNGYYNVYDLNTFQPYNGRRYESTVDPYSVDVRFK